VDVVQCPECGRTIRVIPGWLPACECGYTTQPVGTKPPISPRTLDGLSLDETPRVSSPSQKLQALADQDVDWVERLGTALSLESQIAEDWPARHADDAPLPVLVDKEMRRSLVDNFGFPQEILTRSRKHPRFEAALAARVRAFRARRDQEEADAIRSLIEPLRQWKKENKMLRRLDEAHLDMFLNQRGIHLSASAKTLLRDRVDPR
jgi:hypothetical protein